MSRLAPRTADDENGAEMAYQRRIYEFPGGFLETNAYGEDDDSGVYLELFQPEDDTRDDDERPEAGHAV